MLFHLGHWLHIPMLAANSGLAVDFFFCLSGYVLALSYGNRMGVRMTAGQFLVVRLIRLLPLTVLATAISACFVGVRALAGIGPENWASFGLAVVLGLANLPYLDAPRALGGPQVFPLNGPQYSLFLEIVVNIVWAASPRLRRPRMSAAIIALAVAGVILMGFGGDNSEGFWSGFPRIFASFYIGAMVWRVSAGTLAPRVALPLFVGATLSMFGLMVYPFALPFAVRLLFILIIAPLVVLSGARLPMSGWLSRVALFLGVISYPLYVLHFPIFIWLNGIVLVVAKHHIIAFEVPALLIGGTGAAWLAVKVYDAPLRDWLTQITRASLTWPKSD